MHGFRLLLLSICIVAVNETSALAMCSAPPTRKKHSSKLMDAISTRNVELVQNLIEVQITYQNIREYVNKQTSMVRFKRVQHAEGSPLLFATQQYILSQDVRLLRIIKRLLVGGADPKVTPAGQSESSLQLAVREKSYPVIFLFADYFEDNHISIAQEMGEDCFVGIKAKDLELIIDSEELLKKERLRYRPSKEINSLVDTALKKNPAEFYISALEDKRLRMRDLIFKRMIEAGAFITVPLIDQSGRRDPLNILLEKDKAVFVDVLKLPHLFEFIDVWSHYKIELLNHFPKELPLLIHMMQAEKVLSVLEKYHYLDHILNTFQNDLNSLIQVIEIPNLLDSVTRGRFLNIILKNFINSPSEMGKIYPRLNFLNSNERNRFIEAVFQQFKDNQGALFEFVENPELLSPPDRFYLLSKIVDSYPSDMDLIFRIMKLRELPEEHLQPFATRFFALYENAINSQNIEIVYKYLGRFAPESSPFIAGNTISARDRYSLYYRLAQNLDSGYFLAKIAKNTVVTQEHLNKSFEMFSSRGQSNRDFGSLQTELLQIFDATNFAEIEKSGKFNRNNLVGDLSIGAIRINIAQMATNMPYNNQWQSHEDANRHKNIIAHIVQELPRLSPELKAEVLTTLGRGKSCGMGVMGTLIMAESLVLFQSDTNQFKDIVTRILFVLTSFRESLFIDEAMKDSRENQHILNYLHHRFGKWFGLPGPHPVVFEYLTHVPTYMKAEGFYHQFVRDKYSKKAIIKYLVNKVNFPKFNGFSNNLPYQDLVEWCKAQGIPTDNLMFDPETLLITEIGMEIILMDPKINVLSFL